MWVTMRRLCNAPPHEANDDISLSLTLYLHNTCHCIEHAQVLPPPRASLGGLKSLSLHLQKVHTHTHII